MFAVSWTDKDDNLWLFGGSGAADGLDHTNYEFGWFSDVWKFDGEVVSRFLPLLKHVSGLDSGPRSQRCRNHTFQYQS